MRVNARFEGTAEQQVNYLTTSTGKKVSDVLRDSVAFYYQHMRTEGGKLRHLTPWVGQGDSGHSDIAADVKQHLGADLEAKHALVPVAPTGRRQTPSKATRRSTP